MLVVGTRLTQFFWRVRAPLVVYVCWGGGVLDCDLLVDIHAVVIVDLAADGTWGTRWGRALW